jgi:hypothetical protein
VNEWCGERAEGRGQQLRLFVAHETSSVTEREDAHDKISCRSPLAHRAPQECVREGGGGYDKRAWGLVVECMGLPWLCNNSSGHLSTVPALDPHTALAHCTTLTSRSRRMPSISTGCS